MGLVVDILLIVILLAAAAWGVASGVLAILGSALGLVVGGIAVWWLLPVVAPLVPEGDLRGIVLVGGSFAVLLGAVVLGGVLGGLLRRGAERLHLHVLDRILGGVVGVVVSALALSLVAQSAAVAGVPGLSTAVTSSRVLGIIEDLTPPPLASALAQVRQLVFVDALPQVGALLDVSGAAPPSSPVALNDPALNAAAQSVARVSGTAYACSRALTGSGFVVAEDRVITNAHVLAGVEEVVVELPGRAAATGRVVWFDPAQDLAVIAVETDDAAPLRLAGPQSPGASGAVAGYPFGGPFSLGSASVRSVGVAEVPDIYEDGLAPREIYALSATISPGNSGGPFLTAEGEAAGVVFARADDGSALGYAVTSAAVAPIVADAARWSEPVSTGPCID